MWTARLAVGDVVRYARDGARGLVIQIVDNRCLVIWEDLFVSWEPMVLLEKVSSG